jgi:sialidase-1
MHAAEGLTLAGQRDEVLAGLKTRRTSDDQERCGPAREAIRAGDNQQVAVLLDILDKPDSNGHTHAAESMFKLFISGDGTKLRAAAKSPAVRKLQLMAAAALARAGEPDWLDLIRSQVASDVLDDRKSAAWLLGQIGSPADVPLLEKGWKAEKDELTRAYFAHALACLGHADARPVLIENLSSANPMVRTYAAEFAGYCRATEARARLIALLTDPVRDVRVRAAQSLVVLMSPKQLLGRPPQ